MKICAINGSPRKRGNTARLLSWALDGVKNAREDAETELINKTADQYRDDADYLRDFARKSNALSQELAGDVETMNNAMGEIAKATQEEATGNTTVAEKVTQVAEKANAILAKVHASQEGADKLKAQVERFKV